MCLTLYRSIGFLVALIFVSAMGVSIAVAEPANTSLQTIRVVMDDNYPPYVFKETDGRLKGILVDQWYLWEKRTGIPVQLNAMDWEEAQHRMQAGEFDVIDTLFRNEQRERIYDFSKPYAQIDVPIFFRSDISGIRDENDLRGFAVGVKAGDSAIAILKTKGVASLIEFKSYEAIVTAARDGKLNVFTVDKPPALYFLFKMGIHDRFNVSRPLYTGQFHRAVMKGHHAILEKVESGFAQIVQAEYEEIEQRWYGAPILSQKWMRYISIGVAAAILILALLFFWLWFLRRMVAQRTAALEQEVRLRVQQEKQLKDSNDRFQSIFNAGNEAIFIHEVPSFKIIDVNQTMCEMYGYSREEALHLSAGDVSSGFAPYTRSDARIWFKKAMTGELLQFEWHTKHKTGRLFWAEIKMKLSTIGSDDRIIVTVRDITDRRLMQESIRKNEEWYRLNFENVRDVIYRIDTDFIFRSISPGVEKLLGYKPEELIGRTFQDLNIISSEYLPQVVSNTKRILSGEYLKPSIYEFIAKDGTRLFGEVIGSPLYQDNKIIGLVAVARDITERNQAEELLKKSEARLNRAEIASKSGNWELHLDSLVMSGSDGARRLFGVEKNQYEYAIIKNIPMKEYRQMLDDSLQNLVRNDKPYDIEYKIKAADTCEIKDIHSFALFDKEKRIVFGIVQDITERKKADAEKIRLEARLLQAQKMEAIGLLAGGIAHDLNNILFPVSGLSEMLLDMIPSENPWYESIEQIHKSAQRGSDLVKQILALSRQSDLQKLPIRIQPILKEVLTLSRSTISQNIKISSHIETDCGMVSADPTQLHQIFMNLITNAYHAVERIGGAIHVTLKEAVFTDDQLYANAQKSGRYACIAVQDTGIGIDRSMIDKIFTPYFTTKEQGKGTGLGLSVVHGIVKDHGGDIQVDSEIGKGTIFYVYLPLLEEAKDMQPIAVAIKHPAGCERVLLIDDEEPVALLEQMMLEKLGYKVTVRIKSLDALADFRADPLQFDLVISDRSMPNMTGIQLARELISIRPEIPIIICTGFTEEKEEQFAMEIGVKGFLIKPVSIADLAQMARTVLDEMARVKQERDIREIVDSQP